MSEKKPRELFKERNQRVFDAIALKEPDRVPITPLFHFFPTEQKGLTKKEAMYDRDKFSQAAIEITRAYNWDQASPIITVWSGELLDVFGAKFMKWPGATDENQRLKDDQPFQFVEAEYMKANEYEEFFSDPTGFFLRKVIPRNCTKLKGFEQFPNLVGLGYNMVSIIQIPLFFAFPDSRRMIQTIQEGSNILFKFLGNFTKYQKDLKKLGFPLQFASMAIAPFDVIGDALRGMRGSMLDMYRKPEELEKMVNMLIQPSIDLATLLGGGFSNLKVTFIPLHRGADGFMSNKQFETYYWPSLTKLMDGLIKNGIIPMPFYEGGYNDRLEYLAEYAKKNKGKLIYWFDKIDLIKANELLGDYVCIRGDIPASLLVSGKPSQIEEYIKKNIEICAEGGGYIVDGGVGIPDEAKAENVKAMTDAVFKYGVYRK